MPKMRRPVFHKTRNFWGYSHSVLRFVLQSKCTGNVDRFPYTKFDSEHREDKALMWNSIGRDNHLIAVAERSTKFIFKSAIDIESEG